MINSVTTFITLSLLSRLTSYDKNRHLNRLNRESSSRSKYGVLTTTALLKRECIKRESIYLPGLIPKRKFKHTRNTDKSCLFSNKNNFVKNIISHLLLLNERNWILIFEMHIRPIKFYRSFRN